MAIAGLRGWQHVRDSQGDPSPRPAGPRRPNRNDEQEQSAVDAAGKRAVLLVEQQRSEQQSRELHRRHRWYDPRRGPGLLQQHAHAWLHALRLSAPADYVPSSATAESRRDTGLTTKKGEKKKMGTRQRKLGELDGST